MKKFSVIAVAALLILSVFAACGYSSADLLLLSDGRHFDRLPGLCPFQGLGSVL